MESATLEQREYKLVRSYRMPKSKLRTFIRPSSCNNKRLSNFEAKVRCQLLHNQQKNFNADVIGDKLAVYDDNTYAEAKFNDIYANINKKRIWADLTSEISLHSNFLLIYLQSSKSDSAIFTNEALIKNITKSEQEIQKNLQNLGIIQNSINKILKMCDKNNNEQILISVVGFSKGVLIDLLNFQQNFTTKIQSKLRIKKQNKIISVQNMSQVAVQSMESFLNIFLLSTYLKELHNQQSVHKIQAQVFQICIGRLTKERQNIQTIRRKYNFVKISNEETYLSSVMGTCLKQILYNNNKLMSNRNSKVTFFLEDCLNNKTNINIMTEVDLSQKIKSQINLLSFNDYINKSFRIQKNYLGNQNILQKLKRFGNQTAVLNLTIYQSRQRNLEKLKKQKYNVKYQSKINRALMTETHSSAYKRRTLEPGFPQVTPLKSTLQFSHTLNIPQKEKQQIIRKVYKNS